MMRLLSKSLFVLILSAFLFAGNQTVEEGKLLIPLTEETITIDGELDQEWKNVTPVVLRTYEEGSDVVDSYDDHFSTFRTMYSEDFLYIFVTVVDDSLDSSTGNDWDRDNVELFLDGNNDKNDQATGYDDNDVQWRWIWNSDKDTSLTPGQGEYAFTTTDEGYNLEIAISADTLSAYAFELTDGETVGFEISNRDMDSQAVQNNIKWWNAGATAWNTPALFGTAKLTDREVKSTLDINEVEEAPEIDGVIEDDAGWLGIPAIGLTTIENGDLEDGILTSWEDHFSTFRAGFDEDALYIAVEVVDDSLDSSTGNDWDRDNIELFLDGNNDKNDQATGYDANDVQWRWIWNSDKDTSLTPGQGEYVFSETDNGYILEIAISADTLSNYALDLVDGETIGFEISNRDMDSQQVQINRKWWNEGATAWNTPALFGTAKLNGTITAIENEFGVPNTLELKQNFPNPFNPNTRIDFTLDKAARVSLEVFNVLGQRVAVLINGQLSAGANHAIFNGHDLPSGIYVYKLTTGSSSIAKKMMLIK